MGEKIFEMGMTTSRNKRGLEGIVRLETKEGHCYHHFGLITHAMSLECL